MNADDIIKKKFSRAILGYDVREVDEFLDEVIKALEACEKQKELDLVRIKTLIAELERRAGRPAAAAIRQEMQGVALQGRTAAREPQHTTQNAAAPVKPVQQVKTDWPVNPQPAAPYGGTPPASIVPPRQAGDAAQSMPTGQPDGDFKTRQ